MCWCKMVIEKPKKIQSKCRLFRFWRGGIWFLKSFSFFCILIYILIFEMVDNLTIWKVMLHDFDNSICANHLHSKVLKFFLLIQNFRLRTQRNFSVNYQKIHIKNTNIKSWQSDKNGLSRCQKYRRHLLIRKAVRIW
jgi:hypothetical protein